MLVRVYVKVPVRVPIRVAVRVPAELEPVNWPLRRFLFKSMVFHRFIALFMWPKIELFSVQCLPLKRLLAIVALPLPDGNSFPNISKPKVDSSDFCPNI